MDIIRQITHHIINKIALESSLIQILIGPRQVGKTTSVLQVGNLSKMPFHYASCDSQLNPDTEWLKAQWLIGRNLVSESPNNQALLIIDEAQSINRWAEIVKPLWDEDRRKHITLKVVITGSSSILLKQKTNESLAGRFELNIMKQWSYSEMCSAFNYTLNDFMLYGGYPGSAQMITDIERWQNYVKHSLIETAITKDILSLERILKPALLRQLYVMVSSSPAQEVSYNKLIGQLADAGNAQTLAHYQHLLEDAFLLKGLEKWTGFSPRKRASTPKWILLDNALITGHSLHNINLWQEKMYYGRLVENQVGAHLLKLCSDVYYWREGKNEVDFVVPSGRNVYAIEVKSGSRLRSKSGLKAFANKYPSAKPIIIGADGISLETFLKWDKWKQEI